MKLGKLKTVVFFLFLFLIYPFKAYSEEKIISVPLINLEELSPTFEEDKDELEKNDKNVSIGAIQVEFLMIQLYFYRLPIFFLWN